jgi:threonine dehydratase
MNAMPTYHDIVAARQRIADYAYITPLLRNETLNRLAGADIWFKCENLQRTGAFKMRGATNFCIKNWEHIQYRGVATHSSGNHARSLACIARLLGIPAHIVMPENSPATKVRGVQHEGGHITFCASTLAAREETLAYMEQQTGALFVPPYDHPDIIAGQGTAVMEALDVMPMPHVVIPPVGGGGLLSGSALAAKGRYPGITVYGAEPAGADDAYRSFVSGTRVASHTPETIADGLRTTLGVLPFQIILSQVDGIMLAYDTTIMQAMKLLVDELKVVVEPSGAVPLAAILQNKSAFAGKTVLVVISGGNTDLVTL